MTQRQSLQRQVAYGHIRQSPVLKGLVELRLMAMVFWLTLPLTQSNTDGTPNAGDI